VNLESTFYWLMHSILGFRVNGVQASAKQFQGYCTWPFSQVVSPVKNLICSYPDTSGGICEMLAAKWLEQHAKGGSIVNWISSSGDVTEVDNNKVRQLMQLFAVGTTMRSGAMVGKPQTGRVNQDLATETWLRSQGVIKRRQLTGGVPLLGGGYYHPSRGASAQPGRQDFSTAIARDIIQSKGSYKIIGINGPQFSHAMAAWSDEDVSFFDPNFGEYWFARPQDFVSWLPNFWYSAGYDMPVLGLNSGYVIQEFALSL